MHREKHCVGKDVLVGEYRISAVFVAYHIFAQTDAIERLKKDAMSRFNETNKDNSIMNTTFFLKTLPIYIILRIET